MGVRGKSVFPDPYWDLACELPVHLRGKILDVVHVPDIGGYAVRFWNGDDILTVYDALDTFPSKVLITKLLLMDK